MFSPWQPVALWPPSELWARATSLPRADTCPPPAAPGTRVHRHPGLQARPVVPTRFSKEFSRRTVRTGPVRVRLGSRAGLSSTAQAAHDVGGFWEKRQRVYIVKCEQCGEHVSVLRSPAELLIRLPAEVVPGGEVAGFH